MKHVGSTSVSALSVKPVLGIYITVNTGHLMSTRKAMANAVYTDLCETEITRWFAIWKLGTGSGRAGVDSSVRYITNIVLHRCD